MANAQAKEEKERALLESERRYRTIVENTNDAIIIHDFQGIILDVNENTCHLLHYQREDLLGHHLKKIINSPDIGFYFSRIEDLIEEGSLLFEAYHQRRDGTEISVEVSAKVVSTKGEGIIQSFARDITDRKEAQEQLKEYTEELEERNR